MKLDTQHSAPISLGLEQDMLLVALSSYDLKSELRPTSLIRFLATLLLSKILNTLLSTKVRVIENELYSNPVVECERLLVTIDVIERNFLFPWPGNHVVGIKQQVSIWVAGCEYPGFQATRNRSAPHGRQFINILYSAQPMSMSFQ
jgi:hypothetical protein